MLAPAAVALDLQRCSGDLAVGVVRHQGGEIPPALRGGVSDNARDVLLDHETQQEDTVAGSLAIIGKGENRHVGGAGDGSCGLDRSRHQRAEDDLGAFLDGFLGSGPSAFGRALVVLEAQLQIGVAAVDQRHLAGLLQGLGNSRGRARQRQRQQHDDLGRAALGRGRLRRGSVGQRAGDGRIGVKRVATAADRARGERDRQSGRGEEAGQIGDHVEGFARAHS